MGDMDDMDRMAIFYQWMDYVRMAADIAIVYIAAVLVYDRQNEKKR